MRICRPENPAPATPCATLPRAISKADPIYPAKAREKGSQGTVTLGITVTSNGSVSGAHVVKGVDPDIDQAAIDAVDQWKFEPGRYQGRPGNTDFTVKVNFRLDPSSPNQSAAVASDNAGQIRDLYSGGLEAYKRQDYATAANMFRRITSLAPQNGIAWNDLGLALLGMNQLDAAADAFKKAIQKDPSSRDAYNNLGRAYWRKGEYEDAAAQFRKQLVINPNDHYAHRNLGMMLRDQKKCSEAMPELAKSLEITPNYAETLVAQGECDLDLGNRAKGISELQQATAASAAPGTLNQAAYALATRDVELDMAEKWSETCLTVERLRLQDISLEHLTAEQLNYVSGMASYWDTRGWIYFFRGDYPSARSYIEASWALRRIPTIGDHLGQIYEKLGMKPEARQTYAMAIAAADRPGTRVNAEDLADAKRRLQSLTGPDLEKDIASARADLNAASVVLVHNTALTGSGDFTLRFATTRNQPEIQQVAGDAALAKFIPALELAAFPVYIPKGEKVEIPMSGTLTCHSEEAQCRFALLSPEDAVTLTRTEMAAASVQPSTSTPDPHIYDSPAIGIRFSLADEWKLIREEPDPSSRGRTAVFGKPASLALFAVTRDRLESSPELYEKMLESFFSQRDDYNRKGQESISRDGFAGTRWYVQWNQNNVPYMAIIEFFSVNDDHYRLTAAAPKEVFPRYTEAFENMFHSVKFPLLHNDPEALGSPR